MDPMGTDGSVKLSSEILIDQLPLSESLSTVEIHGESRVFPRIGEEYQAEIPNIAIEDEFFRRRLSSLGFDYPIETGLDIPVSWVVHVREEQNLLPDSNICIESNVISDYIGQNPLYHGAQHQAAGYKVESTNNEADSERPTGSLHKECAFSENKMSFSLLKQRSEKYIPLPGSPSSSWTDAETQSFLLGLYMFGKNLFHVRNFMECKMIGDILFFYYGKFYGSDAYRRWSERRKKRSGRCIFGPRIFIGWRQQELLSRLLLVVPEEVRDPFLEVFKTFNENRSSFMEFISALKTRVGVQALVEAIGIGRGKRDLTRIILDSARANQASSTRTEMPTGKSYSSLSYGDIIKFLTGDFRLSKARSTDLFWEAVWPRLLARGWRSEKPKDPGLISSKHALVFLVPGVGKFSRKKLVKGNHYFDSVSDVLSKVASDPRLLELETEEVKSEQNALPDNQSRCYLGPGFPEHKSELMKFTVVDTSLADGEPPFKVRDLRSLPIDAIYMPCTNLDITRSDGAEENSNLDDSLLDGQDEGDQGVFHSTVLENDCRGREGMKSVEFQDHGQSLTEQLCILNNIDQISTPGQQVYVSPLSKKRRLSAREHELTGLHSCPCPKRHQLKKEGTRDNPDPNAGPDQQCKYSIDLNVTPRPHASIDLNLLPHIPSSEDETVESFMSFDEQSSLNLRRQSTRSRPPTTRALEALACGFLGAKSMCRDLNASSSSGSSSKRSRHRRKSVEAAGPLSDNTDGLGCAVIGDSGATADGWHEIALSGSMVQPDGKEAHELLWLS